MKIVSKQAYKVCKKRLIEKFKSRAPTYEVLESTDGESLTTTTEFANSVSIYALSWRPASVPLNTLDRVELRWGPGFRFWFRFRFRLRFRLAIHLMTRVIQSIE
eukprot:SAG22_NODE_12693_length_432_cov_2.735736_1_plen_103_part_01